MRVLRSVDPTLVTCFEEMNEPFARKGAVMITLVSDVEDTIRRVAEIRKECPGGYVRHNGKLPTQRMIGSIPRIELARHPELLRDEDAIPKFLNDHPEYRVPTRPIK